MARRMLSLICALAICAAAALPSARTTDAHGKHFFADIEFHRREGDARAASGAGHELHPRSSYVSLDGASIIPWGEDQATAYKGDDWLARRFVLSTINTRNSSLLFFPYIFSAGALSTPYGEAPADPVVFSEGAFLLLDGGAAPPQPYEGYFHWWDAGAALDVSGGASLFAVRVAILRVALPIDLDTNEIVDASPDLLDLTWESAALCAALVAQLPDVYDECFANATALEAHLAALGDRADTAWASYITHEEVQAGMLFDAASGAPRFDVLFVPDVERTMLQYAANNIGAAGSAQIASFAAAGGTLYASGHGAAVIDLVGRLSGATQLLPPPPGKSTFYNYRKLLRSPDSTEIQLTGCEQTLFSDAPELYDGTNAAAAALDIARRTLCFALARNSDQTKAYAFYNTSYIPHSGAEAAAELTQVQSISWTSSLVYADTSTGGQSSVGLTDNLPGLLFKKYGAGSIALASHLLSQSDYGLLHLYSALLLAAQRPLAVATSLAGGGASVFAPYSAATSALPLIPAREKLPLSYTLNFVNLGTDVLDDAGAATFCAASQLGVKLFPVPGLSVAASAASQFTCTTSAFPADVAPELLPAAALDQAADVLTCCSDAELAALEFYPLQLEVSVEDAAACPDDATAALFYYVTEQSTRSRRLRSYSFALADGVLAASVRPALGLELKAQYPLRGRGVYSDLVLHAFNGGASEAFNTEATIVVPLLSPVVDAADRRAIAAAAVFDAEYFTGAGNSLGEDFTVEWIGTDPADVGASEHKDVVCFQDLVARGAFLAADWDTPARCSLADLSEYGLTAVEGTVAQLPMAAFTAHVTDRDLLVQAYFEDADASPDAARQRLLPFLDPVEPLAATTLWGADMSQIPADDYSANNNCGRARLVFARNDVYFPSSEMFPMPSNLALDDRAVVFTADKVPTDALIGWTATDGRRAEAFSGLEGAYSRAAGLEPSRWENELLLNPDVTIVPFFYPSEGGADPFGGDARFSPDLPEGFSAARTYALFPVEDDQGVLAAGDVWEFDASTGRHSEYDELVFVTPLTLELTIPANVGRRGGLIEIVTATDISARVLTFDVAPYDDMPPVSASTEQISVVETAFTGDGSTSTISVTYTRTLFATEDAGTDYPVTVFVLVGLANTASVAISAVTVRELTYELGTLTGGMAFSASGTSLAAPSHMTCEGAFLVPAVSFTFSRSASIVEELEQEELDLSIMGRNAYQEAYARIGVYTQELMHRPLHGRRQVQTQERPHVTASGEFSTFAAVGANSQFFRRYTQSTAPPTGLAAPATSSFAWTDIWGRRFFEPLPSVSAEFSPLAPSARSFSVAASFELLDLEGARLDYWPSDTPVDMHVTLKAKNSFPKFFDVAVCPENRIYHACADRGCSDMSDHVQIDVTHNVPVIDYSVFPLTADENATQSAGSLFCSPSTHLSQYGVCYAEAPAYLAGAAVDAALFPQLEDIYQDVFSICALDEDPSTCENVPSGYAPPGERVGAPLAEPDLSAPDTLWNYAARAAGYYPAGYVAVAEMWDLTAPGYVDRPFAKAFPFHADCRLPSIANDLDDPETHLFVAVYTGVGFSVDYDAARSNPGVSAGAVAGWYSSNLQNRDDTLLAGNAASNDIASVSDALIDVSSFTELSVLEGTGAAAAAADALTNVNVCLFNRWFLRSDTDAARLTYPFNTNVNNVIPLAPSLTQGDARLSAYGCDAERYLPENISLADGFAQTPSHTDFLYLAMALRGGASEDVHVLTRLAPSTATSAFNRAAHVLAESVMAFAAPDGPLDTPVLLRTPDVYVDAKLNVINFEASILSPASTTFNATAYLLFKLADPLQPFPFFRDYNSLSAGFGDITVATHVGGSERYSAMFTERLAETIVRFEITNNAGYDIELLVSAMDWDGKATLGAPASGRLRDYVSHVRAPSALNFLAPVISGDVGEIVEFEPVAFEGARAQDFLAYPNTHAAAIRDGETANYFLKMTLIVDNSALRGHVIDIPFVFCAEHFANLPGTAADARGAAYVGRYELAPPPARFAYTYSDEQAFPGAAFFAPTGPARYLSVDLEVPPPFAFEAALAATDAEVAAMAALAAAASAAADMDAYWTELASTEQALYAPSGRPRAIPYDSADDGAAQAVRMFLNTTIDGLPFTRDGSALPQQSAMYVLARLGAVRVAAGWNEVHTASAAQFIDWRGEQKAAAASFGALHLQAKGPWLRVATASAYVDYGDDAVAYAVVPYNTSVAARTTVRIRNEGDAAAHRVNVTLAVRADADFFPALEDARIAAGLVYEVRTANGTHYELALFPDADIAAGGEATLELWFKLPVRCLLAGGADDDGSGVKEYTLIADGSTVLDRTAVLAAERFEQPQPYSSVVRYEIYSPVPEVVVWTFMDKYGYVFIVVAIVLNVVGVVIAFAVSEARRGAAPRPRQK